MLDVVDGARPPLKRSTPSTSERRDRHTGKAQLCERVSGTEEVYRMFL